MARMRSVKPEFWTDRKLAARLSRDARLLYIALWNQADEWSRVHGDTRYVKGHCLPYDDDLSLGAIDRLLDELDRAGVVQRYEVDGDPYLYLPKLANHQRLEPSKVPSRLPDPPKPGARRSASRADSSERRADEPAPRSHEIAPDFTHSNASNSAWSDEPAGQGTSSESRADEFAPRADTSGTIVALHVAGGMWQEAGSREHVPPTAAAPAALSLVEPPATAATIVAAYVDACREVGQIIDGRAKGRVAREAAQLLKDGAPHDLIIEAARRLAANGFADLGAEARRLRAQPRTDPRIDAGTAILREAYERGQRERRELEAGA